MFDSWGRIQSAPAAEALNTSEYEDYEDGRVAAAEASKRRWKMAAGAAGALVLGLSAAVANLVTERAELATVAEQSSAIGLAREQSLTRSNALLAQLRGEKGAAAASAAAAAAPALALASDASTNKKTYGDATISVDQATPKSAREKFAGMSLVLSDEFKDLERTQSIFTFEDVPYGVPGNTGDINIVSTYNKEMVELVPGGGMRLKSAMSPEHYKLFQAGTLPNGTACDPANSLHSGGEPLPTTGCFDTLPEIWDWHAPKVTSRINGRFQYGMVEVRLKAPKGYGPWPAAWLNGCYGFVAEASGEFLTQEDYPFLCGQFWPPELDFFEHFSPEHTWFWRPNSMSVHSPNQYVGLGRKTTTQHGYCPTTLAGPGEAWCFGVSGAGTYTEDPTERFITYNMLWEPEGVSFYMDGRYMLTFTKEQLVLYLSGQLRPILIPEMPLFLTFNTALVRKGMDASHSGPGLTSRDNFDKHGNWKGMDFDLEYVRVYQDDTQGDTRGLNPPITYETRKKLLANRVTCNLMPELRCMIKNSTEAGKTDIFEQTCAKLKSLGDDYCDGIEHLCSLNNAANPSGTYGLDDGMKANMANQRLSFAHGACCVSSSTDQDLVNEHAHCVDTPKTKLPQWLLDSEYFQDPKQGAEGAATGVAGTNPAGWKTYGLGLPPPAPVPTP